VKQDLYNTSKGDGVIPPYRIPGITTASNGRLITAAARLVCGTDPGYGQVDVVCRYSDNNGDTWSDMIDVAVGTGRTSATENYFDTAFGDPAIVADRTSSEVLIIAVAGCTVYGNGNTTRQNPNMIATIHSTDNGNTWGEPVNVTEPIYSLFDSGNPIQAAFVGGGKIFQSRIVKKNQYYRLYAAMCARPNGNRVIYSDDFGRTWHALGGASALPAPGGDEPKCEELPDGRVILSSRVGGGRIYNIYTYSNTLTAEGKWGTSVKSTFEGSGKTPGGNSTNGEILIVPAVRNSDNGQVHLVLQSLPTGGGRSNVGIFYKEIADAADIKTVQDLATGWDGYFEVTTKSSAYSSMDLQADDRIGFIYEETLTGFGKRDNPVSTSFPTGAGQHNFDGFDNIYVAYPLDYITGGAYSINAIITNIGKSEISNQKSEMIYDLQGRRHVKLSKGIYIRDGKKVVSK
jgi:sialidase-1